MDVCRVIWMLPSLLMCRFLKGVCGSSPELWCPAGAENRLIESSCEGVSGSLAASLHLSSNRFRLKTWKMWLRLLWQTAVNKWSGFRGFQSSSTIRWVTISASLSLFKSSVFLISLLSSCPFIFWSFKSSNWKNKLSAGVQFCLLARISVMTLGLCRKNTHKKYYV